MVIGITGGTGSGKSTVCKEFHKAGFLIFDADAIYSELTTPNSKLVNEIVSLFGDEAAPYPERALDRKHLANIVFSDKEKLAKLNALTHKAVLGEIQKRIDQNKEKNIIIDVPLLFESGADKMCDEIWTVTADLETRISRVMGRDKITREDVIARIDNQMSDDERIAKSKLVIKNDSKAEMKSQVKQIISERF